MIKTSTTVNFSCFPTIEEEGADKFTDIEETQSEINTEETEFENHFQGICSITKDKRNPFATWQPFIPQESVFQNSLAQPWWSVSSPPGCSSLEPTLTIISSISCPTSKKAIKPTPLQVSPEQTNHQLKQIPPHTGELYKPTTKRYRHSWSERWPELDRTSRGSRGTNLQITKNNPNHPGFGSSNCHLWTEQA
jgi:hypothetical protein